MAGLLRKTLFQFASAASNNGVFGTAQLGTKVLSNDPTVIQGISGGAPSTAWQQGWLNATISSQNLPPLEEMQGLQFVQTYHVAYLLARGLSEYDTGTTYNIGDITRPAASSQLYMSLINTNLGNALPSAVSNSNWQYLGDLASLGTGVRTRLTTTANYYVATTGNDSNPGTSGSPWLTLGKAVSYIQNNLDLAGNTVNINVADGTYTGGISVTGPWFGAGTVNFIGNTTTPANCIISTTSQDAILAQQGAIFNVGGFKVQTTTSGRGIQANTNAEITLTNAMNIGACANEQMYAPTSGLIVYAANYTISGSAPYHWSATTGGEITFGNAVTITLTGTPAFSSSFAFSNALGIISSPSGGITFSGAATGVRYVAQLNGIISVTGGGASYLPGNSAGSTATGGQYA